MSHLNYVNSQHQAQQPPPPYIQVVQQQQQGAVLNHQFSQPQIPYIQQYINNTPIPYNNTINPRPSFQQHSSILQPMFLPHQHQKQPQPVVTQLTAQQIQHQQQIDQMEQEFQKLQVQNNNNNFMESSYQSYLFKIKEKFEKFSAHHVGNDNILFEKEAPLPTHKECNTILLKLQYGRNIHTSLLPFTLPVENYKPPEFFTKIDIIQYHLSGLASILVLMKLSGDQSFSKTITLSIIKSKFMIEKLAKIFQQQLDNRIASNSNGNLLPIPTSQSTILSSQRNNNPIIIYFNQQFEYIQQLKKYYDNNEISSNSLVNFAQTLFSLLTCKGYFWYIGDEINQMVKNNIFEKIFDNLQHTVLRDPNETKYKYNFGCYCYSYFKISQSTHQISSNRFVNFKSKSLNLVKPPAKEEEIYNYLLFFLNLANDQLVKAFINPISDSQFWLIYARTCCLLDQEEKAHTWIQYYINEATDRVTAASLIQLDEDIKHYSSKSWYIDIMKSIEDEKKKRIQEDDERLNKQRQAQLATSPSSSSSSSQASSSSSPHIVGGQTAQDQYYNDIKTTLLLEGLVLKNMNHDATLISSNVLLNLHPPMQSQEVQIAQERLNQRLELYMLKNSKEIPGDGNCQMHALSDQLYGDLNHSQDVRKTIVDWLRKNKDFSLPNGATICQFVNTNNWDDYCNDMSKNGNWGDHLTLLAAAELFGSKISIISSVESQSNFFIEIIPTKIRNDKVLLLSHYAEFHYGSLCPLR